MRKKKDDATIRRYDDTRVPYFCKSIFPLFKYGVLIAVMSAHFFTSSTDAEEPPPQCVVVALVVLDDLDAAAWTTTFWTPASRPTRHKHQALFFSLF